MWHTLMIVLVALTAAMFLYLAIQFHGFSVFRHLSEKSRLLSWVASLLPAALPALFALINTITMEIVVLHTALAFALLSLVGLLVRKVLKRSFSRDLQRILALALAVVYLGTGWFLAHHVFRTSYTFETEKALDTPLRIVEVADAHLGITLDSADFAREMEKVQKENPDLVVIVGDFVDDDSDKKDMLEACEAIGRLETTYGVYFVFGNHDNGYYRYRNFSSAELRAALSENNVIILEDENVLIDGRFYLIGRRDRSMPGRASAQSLTEGLDLEKYMIMLDHQPNDYANETASGADLVLSGHTHGGHIFPAGQIGLLMGSNDRRYGTETRETTTFVVTSGISGWGIPFKTGTFSEYVVIDVKMK